VPLDWSQPVAMGTFYDTIMKPALEAIGVPASRPATDDTPAVRGVRCTISGIRSRCYSYRRERISCR
jgi:hypothetical protein